MFAEFLMRIKSKDGVEQPFIPFASPHDQALSEYHPNLEHWLIAVVIDDLKLALLGWGYDHIVLHSQ